MCADEILMSDLMKVMLHDFLMIFVDFLHLLSTTFVGLWISPYHDIIIYIYIWKKYEQSSGTAENGIFRDTKFAVESWFCQSVLYM